MTDAPVGRLSGDQISELDLPDWRSMYETLQTRFLTGTFDKGLDLVNAIGQAAAAANHHPDLDLRYRHLNVTLVSHDVQAKTQRDVDLARTISKLAADRGIAADPSAVQVLELGLDTWDQGEIEPFWKAVLGLDDHPRFGDPWDSAGSLPTIWFQRSERPTGTEHPRQTWHLDIRLPPEIAQQRIDAAIKAGGTLISDDRAPTFTVLADPQGNMVCVCTQVGRSD